MKQQRKRWSIWVAVALVLLSVAFLGWREFRADNQSDGIVSGNGRLEAVEIDIATKVAGRVKEILVEEGDNVTIGQVVALMDTESLEAQQREVIARKQEAEDAVNSARSQLLQRESEKSAASAMVSLREVELSAVRKRTERTLELVKTDAVSRQDADDARAALDSAMVSLSAARAQMAAAEAGVATARAMVKSAESAVETADAAVARVQVEINDSKLVACHQGRIQFVVARAGEVIGAGSRVLNLVDLTDVYMTFFLPTETAGRLAIGAEARLLLDAAPDYVFPATISFVADVAQFTPKTVETESEREKLMFRIRAHVAPELLREYTDWVKTGLPGVAYVRPDPSRPWPDHLEINLPQ